MSAGRAATVQWSEDATIAYVRFGSPERANVIDDDLTASVAAAILEVQDRAHGIVLKTGGPTFCGGGDFGHLVELSEVPPDQIASRISGNIQSLIRTITRCPAPVIARVQGPAVGAGADIMMACDVIIASQEAWVRESWLRLGLIPALGGVLSLRSALGRGKAFDALVTGRDISAEECLAAGIFHRLVPAKDLDTELSAFLAELGQRGRESVRALKQLLRGQDAELLDAHFESAVSFQKELFTSPHFRRAIAAEKKRVGKKNS